MPARSTSSVLAVLCSLSISLASARESQAPPSAESPTIKAWGVVLQVIDALTRHVERKELGLIHSEDMRLYQATSVLSGKDQVAFTDRKDDLTTGWTVFSREVAALHAAADAFNQQESETRLRTVLASFEEIKRFYDARVLLAARSLAERYTCPMHPDVIGKLGDPCPKCGMTLDLPVNLSMNQMGAVTATPHTIRASIGVEAPLTIGVRVGARLVLTGLDGTPITADALREVHTQKIHLLIIDSSLQDYHHEHPVASATPGEYAFSFVPTKPGSYRAWADIQPYATGFQEFAVADMFGPGVGEPITEKTPTLTRTLDGLLYELKFDQREIHAGQPAKGRLRVSKAKHHKPFRELEPLMGAFAHLVAFNEDRETVVHIHPIGTKLLSVEDRGGPDLEFHLYVTKPGFYRFFAQVQIGGASKFVPFGLLVLP